MWGGCGCVCVGSVRMWYEYLAKHINGKVIVSALYNHFLPICRTYIKSFYTLHVTKPLFAMFTMNWQVGACNTISLIWLAHYSYLWTLSWHVLDAYNLPGIQNYHPGSFQDQLVSPVFLEAFPDVVFLVFNLSKDLQIREIRTLLKHRSIATIGICPCQPTENPDFIRDNISSKIQLPEKRNKR